MKRIVVTVSVVFGVATGLSSEAFAQSWRVCNKTADPVRVAVGYAVPGGLLKSEGWFNLGSCSGCATVVVPSDTVDLSTGYLYAEKSRDGTAIVTGDQNLCVTRQAFKIRRSGNCEGRNFQTRQFRQMSINLNKNFTTNINGRNCNL
jgi:uncharacterized membrane protein